MNESEIWSALRPKRKPQKPSTKQRKRKKIVPAKGKTSWGRIYPDGREVCGDDAKGIAEYKRRTLVMAERQNWICGCGCGQGMFRAPGYRYSATFDHEDLRGLGGGTRDDRIWKDGKPYNCAMTYHCNMQRGSKRINRKEEHSNE